MRDSGSGLAETKEKAGPIAKLQRELESLSLAVGKAREKSAVQVTLHAAPQLLSATKLG